MDVTPFVSVVIPTLNREALLCDTVRYFLEWETYPNFEVIVVDQSDAPGSATQALVERGDARLRYARVDYKGLPRARNHGVELATGDIVVFVDDDVVPAPGFLRAHAGSYADPTVVGVAGAAVRPGQALRGRKDVGEIMFERLMKQQEMAFDVEFGFPAQWAAGCNMSFRRQAICALGGFDEVFQRAPVGDDAEFSHRARKCGVIRYMPDARLVHLESPSGGTRDAASEREYLRQVAFCVNYFWYRVEASRIERWAMVWRAFRSRVLNRSLFDRGLALDRLAGFGAGVWDSARLIRSCGRVGASGPLRQ